MVSAGTAFFAAAGDFVYSGPRACFRSFHADAFFLVAGFDVSRLTLLFVSVTRFIALRHGYPLFGFGNLPIRNDRRLTL